LLLGSVGGKAHATLGLAPSVGALGAGEHVSPRLRLRLGDWFNYPQSPVESNLAKAEVDVKVEEAHAGALHSADFQSFTEAKAASVARAAGHMGNAKNARASQRRSLPVAKP
jgi:hypothetical protein